MITSNVMSLSRNQLLPGGIAVQGSVLLSKVAVSNSVGLMTVTHFMWSLNRVLIPGIVMVSVFECRGSKREIFCDTASYNLQEERLAIP